MTRQKRQRFLAMLTALSLFFCDSGLISVAEGNTEEQAVRTLACGIEEHVHTEECYEPVLICGQEEKEAETEKVFVNTFKVHRHKDSCYDADGNLTCGMVADAYYHTHNEYCLDEEGNLVCGLEAKQPHVHTAGCYRQDRKLICEKEETEGHIHSESCYETRRELICETPEDEGHHHGEACYTPRWELTCGQEENEEHTHTDECYTEIFDLTCGEEERDGHIHTEECYREWKELACGLEEAEPHIHDDTCYETTETLICELPTTKHHHTEDCYNESGVLTCGKTEVPTFTCTEENWVETVLSEGHHHTEECYAQQLICEKEEHTHTEECYTEPERSQEEELTEEPAGEAAGEPGEESEEEPIEETAEEPTEESAGEFGEEKAEEPTEGPDKASDDGFGEQPGEDSVDEPEAESGDETGEQSENETGDGSDEESDDEPEEKPSEESGGQLENESAEGSDEKHEEDLGEEPAELPEEETDEIAEKDPERGQEETSCELTGKETDEISGEKLEEKSGEELKEESGEQPGEETEIEPEKELEEEPGEELVEQPDEETGGNPVVELEKEPGEEPAEQLDEEPNKELDGEPVEKPEEKNEEEPDECPAEQPGEEPTDGSSEVLAEEPATEPVVEQPKKGTGSTVRQEKKTEENQKSDLVPLGLSELETEGNEVGDTREILATPTDLEEESIYQAGSIESFDSEYHVTIFFSAEAGIPEGAILTVAEADGNGAKGVQEGQPTGVGLRSTSRMRLMKAAPVEEEPRANIASLTTWRTDEEMPEIILYRKTLDISLVADGKEIEPDPNARVQVTVRLPGIEDGQNVQVRHITEKGSELLESTNDGGLITFETDGFSLFEFTSKAKELTIWSSTLLENTFFGKTDTQTIAHEEITVDNITEGLSVLEAYSVTKSSNLWMTLRQIQDIALNKFESLTLYTVENGNLGSVVRENLTLTDILRFNLDDLSSFALVKDSGLRRKVQDMGNVILDGMMPKDAEVTLDDVTEQYADFFAAKTEMAPAAELPDQADEAETATESRTTLVAYDISIAHHNEEYQPDEDKPINVAIVDSRITANGDIELWHIRDDGTPEQVECFTVEEGKIFFEATGFSAYVVVDHESGTVKNPRVMFHFIAYDGDGSTGRTDSGNHVYYVGEPYQFRNKKGDNQTSQILKNGESLELITDPGNLTDKNFYGWYVVSPKTIEGTTDEYGIGTADHKPYYIWPSMPEAITFESPITITESDINIDDTVHWSLNGVSGTGKVDAAGNVHVFLAPVYEHYHFVNFMLYARDDAIAASIQAGNNLMTRRLIALGSAPTVDVKVSDIRSNSADAVHLIFTGWEYLTAGYNTPDDSSDDTWVQIHTVDYSGAELKDPGRDGTYLTGVSMEDRTYVDLYPIFVEARWVDFFSGATGSGARFVGSRFLESWGHATPMDTLEKENENYFSSLEVSSRQGYAFDGWYAFAVTDETTGEITNLYDENEPNNNAKPVKITYLKYGTGNTYTVETVTVNTTAIKIADENGDVVFNGSCGLADNGDGTGSLFFDGTGVIVFSATGGKLKFHDPLDKLALSARWLSSDTLFTLVYWTEDAQDKDYGNSPHVLVEDIYSANKAVAYTTADLIQCYRDTHDGADPSPDLFTSGATITYDDLKNLGLLSLNRPEAAGAVTAGEEKFYELVPVTKVIGKNDNNVDVYPDSSVTVSGDQSSIFNAFFDRMTFKLVFHIGHDGYVKNAGQMKDESYPNWDGNWIEYMYDDDAVTDLGYKGKGSKSYVGDFSMTYIPENKTATSGYQTTKDNVKGNYPASAEEDLYIIEAKYGTYIGDRWPSPTNPNFSWTYETDPLKTGYNKRLYIWTAYYDSLYAGIANSRPTATSAGENKNGNNSDINGIYEYMSKELCSNRKGTGIILEKVHHLVAYFGSLTNSNAGERFKQYHILIEAIDGTIYDPDDVATNAGDNYSDYTPTTWSTDNRKDISMIAGKGYCEVRSEPVISNLEPWYQLGWDLDGYEMVYSCYDPVRRDNSTTPGQKDYHIYYFYRPIQNELTFMFEDVADRHTTLYDYSMSLADAKNYTGYTDPEKEGYSFRGWYTNEAGMGDSFDFDTERMPNHSVVLYPVFDKLNFVVKIDPNGGEIDRWRPDSSSSNASTGFRPDYHETIEPYNYLERKYIPTDDEEIAILLQAVQAGTSTFDVSTDIYYYMNAQYIDGRDGRFIPSGLRNALYLNAAGIDTYWNYYNSFTAEQFTERGATKFTDKNEWMDAYFGGHDLNTLQKYRKTQGAEHYSFMGWYQVFDDGTLASIPFDFNTEIESDIKIQAQWRLDGGYYLHYNPQFYYDGDKVLINGDVAQWNDPADPTKQLYVDRSNTHILNAPTNITPGYVFRGWRVVRANGTVPGTQYTDWVPIQFDENGAPIYYQPGNSFRVDSGLVSEIQGSGAIIHIQAYYEPEENSYRRPYITNLILDANDGHNGFVNTTNDNSLPELSGPGSQSINTTTELNDGNPTQIKIGDFQSNTAIHLNGYSPLFSNSDGYLLIGFDEGSDPTAAYDETAAADGLRSGSPYVPSYAADSVIAVTRDDLVTLYAIWEPLVYVTFVNTTAEPITVELSGSGAATINIVNEVTGEFDREAITGSITIPANDGTNDGMVKIVLPGAAPGTDTITATATNDHLRKKMSVSGEYRNASPTTPYGTGSDDIRYNGSVTYTGVLQTDSTGIVVTYTENPFNEILYDVNGGTWTETSTEYVEYDAGLLYSLDQIYAGTDGNYTYQPFDPTPPDSSKAFLGWTTNADIAAHTDFSSETAVTWGSTTITPDPDGIVLDKISGYLWDFDDDPSPLYNGDILYAVWSDIVTVVFDLTRSGTSLHYWTQTGTTLVRRNYYAAASIPGINAFYRWGTNGSGKEVTYTVRRGEKVPRPTDPTPTSGKNWVFLDWLSDNSSFMDKTTGRTTINPYVFDFDQRVMESTWLYTSWTSANNFQVYTFTVKNVVDDNSNEDFAYTISADEVLLRYGSSDVSPSPAFSPLSTRLKNGEEYTVRITITKEPGQSGTTHNYDGFDVFAEVIDRDGVVQSGHLLTYNGENDARQYKYLIHVVQTLKDGYTTNVTTDAGGEELQLLLDYDEFTFTSKQGNNNTPYSPIVNGFAGGTDKYKSATVTFTNRRKVDLTLSKALAVIMGDEEHDFTFTLTSVKNEETGTFYPYTKTLKDTSTVSDWLETGDSFTLKHGETIVISLPPEKAVVITETNGYYTAAWTATSGTPTLANAATNAATITMTANAAVTVTNTRTMKTVTVKKIVDGTDQTGTFAFTATLLNDGTMPFAGYTVNSSQNKTTDASGQVEFNLSHDSSLELTIPYGAKLVVAEETLLDYETCADMVDGNQTAVSDDDTVLNSFTLNNVETDGTITFTNTPITVNRVFFDKNNSDAVWNETSQDYENLSGNLYSITEEKITARSGDYEPADPTHSSKVFIGWTANEELAAVTDFSGTASQTFGGQTFTPGTGEILLDKVRSEGLWDFTQDPPYGQTLYAVWSDTVKVTFDIVRTGNNLHTWEGPDTTNTQAPYVFYRSSSTSGSITYTLAKGEVIPNKPNDPSSSYANWRFIAWVKGNTSYRNTTKDPGEQTIINNTFDFSQRVRQDVTLSTSWTEIQPQYFTFTVRNDVINGEPDCTFDYKIEVLDELVWGKPEGGGNQLLEMNPGWGSVTTTLKNDETYTVQVKVTKMTAPWTAYSVLIDVYDSTGALVKSGNMAYCAGSTGQRYSYSSDYKYTLRIFQDEKAGYTTTIGTESLNPNESIRFNTDSTSRSFTFISKQYTTTNQSKCTNNFGPNSPDNLGYPYNSYDVVNYPNNSITVVFTNTSQSRNLTVTKTVTGTDDTSDIFNFTAEVEEITDNVSFWWQKYATTDGTTYTSMTGTGSKGTGTLTSSAKTINFSLGHHQKIVIGGLPDKATVTVTENNGSYTAAWRQDGNFIQPTDGSGTSAVTVELISDTVLDVTNTKPQDETIVAPTGFSARYTPWLLLLLSGLMLLISGTGFIRRKGRGYADDGAAKRKTNVSCQEKKTMEKRRGR